MNRLKSRKAIVIIAGGLFVACILCGVVANLGGGNPTPTPETTALPAVAEVVSLEPTPTPQDTATPAPTFTPRPTPEPTVTPDYSGEAKELEATVTALSKSAEAAGDRVTEQAQAIADGDSYDLVELYRRAKVAAEAWETVKFEMYGLAPTSPDLRRACQDLGLSASYREDAYRSLLKWIDNGQKASDMADFEENMAQAQDLMISGLARIVVIAGFESE